MPLVAVHQTAIDLIMEFEGLELHAYPDPATGGDPWTIGYGHTTPAGPPTVSRGLTITKAEAEAILKRDLQKFADGVFHALTMPVNAYQFGALVSLAFNVGLGNFKKSTLLKKVNAGDFAGAAAQFARWNRAAGKVMAGLTRRRAAEAALFMHPVDAKPATTKPVVSHETQSVEGKSNSAGWIVALAVAGAGVITGLVTGGWNWFIGLFS